MQFGFRKRIIDKVNVPELEEKNLVYIKNWKLIRCICYATLLLLTFT